MQIQPYLFFEGRCDEAIAFYRQALGAEVGMLMHYKDAPPSATRNCPEGKTPPGDKVMHGELLIGGARVLVSDGRCAGKTNFQGFALAMTADSAEQVDRAFNALADGGKVIMPLDKTFFSSRFGMVMDRFGIAWTILAKPAA